jgi:hypothetical protein
MTSQHPFPVKRLILPANGRPPNPSAISQQENPLWHSPVSRARQSVESAMSHRAPTLPDFEVLSESECQRAWKRWLLSHHLFVPTLALTGYCLERAAEAIAAGAADAEASGWVESAAIFRRGCGALFLYGVDFEPCAPIYCGQIRAHMPPAFSGYQTRERQSAFLPGLAAFRESSSQAGAHALHARLHDLWIQSDTRYRECHQRCILRSVPLAGGPPAATQEATSGTPESLRAAYRRHHGKAPEIDNNAFQEFDVWFGIDRREGLTWAGYAEQVAAVIEDIAADLEAGHRLDTNVTADLFDSMNLALTLFERGIGSSDRPHRPHAGDAVFACVNCY